MDHWSVILLELENIESVTTIALGTVLSTVEIRYKDGRGFTTYMESKRATELEGALNDYKKFGITRVMGYKSKDGRIFATREDVFTSQLFQ